MDAKARDLALLAFLSVFCAVAAWARESSRSWLGLFLLGVAAILGAAYRQRR
jgi:cbb3-type cytochrome oxidase subunit 3